tara:strand:+ start:8856 stop:10043 length:1188 start_codon:yes stop_codon:yes gene_type:complete
MSVKMNKKIKVIIGNFNLKDGPYDVFDQNIILLLNEISKEILNNSEYKKFPDLISFGFWCRANNIRTIINNYSFFKNRMGRGTVLHITPSNVPTNFAYSMVFGLLSGNNNIIRLPSKNFFQVKILCDILKKISKKKIYKKSFNRLLLIKYENSDLISSELSKNVEARIIWGGDNTVNKFKSFKTKPRCVDLAFANRYSISLIDSNRLAQLNSKDLAILAKKFYNDTYTMDQFGCSSPNSIFWLGKNNIAKKNFWLELSKVVNKVYDLDLSGANQKISNLMNYTLGKNKKFKANIQNFNLVTLKSKELNFDNFENVNFGTFLEINLKDINYLKKYTSEKLQTITYYGTDFKSIKNFIIKNRIKGIDRIVPIGRAFDLTPEWDGIDIISTLSRAIGN